MHHRWRTSLRTLGLISALLVGWVGAAVAGPVELGPGDHLRLEEARGQLLNAVATLRASPSDAGAARAAEGAMRTIERIFDAYFHGPGLRQPTRRVHVLDLRRPIARTMGGPEAVVWLDGDVFRFDPSIHDQLAEAARARAAIADAVRHRRAALASTPNDLSRLSALHVALLAQGDRQGAARIAARMAQVKAAGAELGEPTVTAPLGSPLGDSR